jgi:hypothetical protein
MIELCNSFIVILTQKLLSCNAIMRKETNTGNELFIYNIIAFIQSERSILSIRIQ